MKDVAVIMGSDSDLPKMQAGIDALKEFGVSYEVKIVSAHRTPEFMQEYALAAEKNGFKIIIAGAGRAAHLPGMVASLTNLPVIGVPVHSGPLNGMDSLLSIAQMPKGVPVATMAIDNSYNAGLLAVRILALNNKGLTTKLEQFNLQQKQKVETANKQLQN